MLFKLVKVEQNAHIFLKFKLITTIRVNLNPDREEMIINKFTNPNKLISLVKILKESGWRISSVKKRANINLVTNTETNKILSLPLYHGISLCDYQTIEIIIQSILLIPRILLQEQEFIDVTTQVNVIYYIVNLDHRYFWVFEFLCLKNVYFPSLCVW